MPGGIRKDILFNFTGAHREEQTCCGIYRRQRGHPAMLPLSLPLIVRSTSARLLPARIQLRYKMTLPKPNTQPPKSALVLHNLPKIAAESDKFRRVLFTGKHSQLVIMTVPVGGEIGEETHSVDQHLYFVSGIAQVVTDGKKKEDIASGDHVVIPAGTLHNFVNTGPTPLIVTTVCHLALPCVLSSPQHPCRSTLPRSTRQTQFMILWSKAKSWRTRARTTLPNGPRSDRRREGKS